MVNFFTLLIFVNFYSIIVEGKNMNQKQSFKLPHTLVLIYSLVIGIYITTWIIPSGQYERRVIKLGANEREVTIPDTFKTINKKIQGPEILLTAPIDGFIEGAPIIIFLFVIGGAFSVIQSTNTITIAINKMAVYFSSRKHIQKFLIPALMVVFSLAGGIFGMSEEVIPFVLIFIPLSLSLGYDSIVGVSIPFLGAAAGFAAAFFNPFTVGVAQGISGLPLYSGLSYRLISWVIGTGVITAFVMIYASKVKKDPKRSPVFEIDKKRGGPIIAGEKNEWNWRHRSVGIIFIGGILILILGVLFKNWYIKPIAGVFLAMGLISGLVGGITPSEIAKKFGEGAKDMINVALIIACGRAILIIADKTKTLDAVLYFTSGLISFFPRIMVAQMMFVVQSFINFFIHSGTAQAALTMPVMSPLSDLVGISRQTSVFAFQLCEFVNPILPTSAVTMGVLGVAKIPWEKWAKWFLPLMLILIILGFLLLIPPVIMNWGPF